MSGQLRPAEGSQVWPPTKGQAGPCTRARLKSMFASGKARSYQARCLSAEIAGTDMPYVAACLAGLVSRWGFCLRGGQQSCRLNGPVLGVQPVSQRSPQGGLIGQKLVSQLPARSAKAFAGRVTRGAPWVRASARNRTGWMGVGLVPTTLMMLGLCAQASGAPRVHGHLYGGGLPDMDGTERIQRHGQGLGKRCRRREHFECAEDLEAA